MLPGLQAGANWLGVGREAGLEGTGSQGRPSTEAGKGSSLGSFVRVPGLRPLQLKTLATAGSWSQLSLAGV